MSLKFKVPLRVLFNSPIFSSFVIRHSSFIYGLWTLAFGLFLFIACDIIDPPYLEDHDPIDSIPSNPCSVVLFDFTGHTCKWCPQAHRAIVPLTAVYGNHVIPIAFHLGYFSKPLVGEKYTTDFRTAEGTELESWFDFVSFPVGVVQTLNPDKLINYTAWSSEVSDALELESPLTLGVYPIYTESTKQLMTDVHLGALKDMVGDYKLALYLLEDGIVDWQKDGEHDPVDVPDYVHNHVFRTSFNTVWGESVTADDVWKKGVNFEKEFSLKIKSPWVVSNCSVVAFIYNDQNKQILQATVQKLEL